MLLLPDSIVRLPYGVGETLLKVFLDTRSALVHQPEERLRIIAILFGVPVFRPPVLRPSAICLASAFPHPGPKPYHFALQGAIAFRGAINLNYVLVLRQSPKNLDLPA
jgi:hypothetical protein